jgi:hypothetical protein
MVSDPATVSAGGSVTIGIKLLDESGNGVGGQQLDFLTSSGVVSGMVDQGGGNYQARLDVPANASGDVMISVATRDGTVSSFMRVPIGGADAAWTSSPFTAAQAQDTSTASSQPVAVAAPPPQPAPQPVAQPVPATQVAVKKSPPPSDHPWIRASAGYVFAGYDYAQGPLTKNTVLYPKQFNVSATSSGIAADVRAFLPMFRYVGAEVGVRSNNYSIDPTALCAGLGRPCDGSAAVPDWYTAFRAVAIGRYVFDVGDNAFHVGARAGFSESDVQVFTVVNNASIVLDQLPLAGMALGAELGAEIGRKVFMHTDFTESLAGGSVPYNHEFGVEIGYAFVPNLFAAVGYDLSIRESTIQNASGAIVGEVSDSFHGLGLDVGVQF